MSTTRALTVLVLSMFVSVTALLGANAKAALPASVDGQALPSLAPMLERVTPAVVNIATRGRVQVSPMAQDPFFRLFRDPRGPRTRPTQSLGSGVIVDAKNGYIMTNHHVIASAEQITVTLRDGRSVNAEVVGADPDSDVAVIRIQPNGLSAVPLANSDNLRVGDFVVAIGNPFGLGQTVTSGIVSALGRSGLGIEGYEDFIQTDASINVGNSGGALVNLRGELIGINTAILASGGGSVGIGFAIPSNMANDIMSQLLSYGQVRRGLLGVTTHDVTPELANALGIPGRSGAVIFEVQRGTAAARAGLRASDVITRVNGKSIGSAGELRNVIGLMRSGEEIELSIVRDGRDIIVNAVLGTRQPTQGALPTTPVPQALDSRSMHARFSGAVLADVGPDSQLYGRVPPGVLVAKVQEGSVAAQYGLRSGDIITGVNRAAVASLEDMRKAASANPNELAMRVRRGGSELYILIQ